MREILFRAKMRTDNGEYKKGDWVFGDLVRLKDGEKTLTMIYGFGEVDSSTVGQYTGLTDKNGRRIFEGDILKYINEDDEPHYITVVFDECAFLIDDQGIIDSDLLTSYTCLGIEVVGNVIDNPELMEGAGQ